MITYRERKRTMRKHRLGGQTFLNVLFYSFLFLLWNHENGFHNYRRLIQKEKRKEAKCRVRKMSPTQPTHMPSMLFSQCYRSTLSPMGPNSHFTNKRIHLSSVLNFTLNSVFERSCIRSDLLTKRPRMESFFQFFTFDYNN